MCHKTQCLADNLLLLRIKILEDVVLWPHNCKGYRAWIQKLFVLGWQSNNILEHDVIELPPIWTPEMRPPLYSGHFKMSFLVQISPWNEATPLIRTLWLVPRVAGFWGSPLYTHTGWSSPNFFHALCLIWLARAASNDLNSVRTWFTCWRICKRRKECYGPVETLNTP